MCSALFYPSYHTGSDKISYLITHRIILNELHKPRFEMGEVLYVVYVAGGKRLDTRREPVPEFVKRISGK